MVKNGITPMPVTLAIGDGANDVSMIQEAHLGVGISGKEGLQAVNSSDVAIAQFRFLTRLLLVHGRWNYRRLSKVVLYSFYKNIGLTISTMLFQFYCGWSGQAVYEEIVYTGFNFFLFLPILYIGVHDKDISAETASQFPPSYGVGRLNSDLNPRQIIKYITMAFAVGCIVFFVPLLHWYSSVNSPATASTADGHSEGIMALGSTTYQCLIWTMTIKVLFMQRTWTKWTPAFTVGVCSIAFFYLAILLYNSKPVFDALWLNNYYAAFEYSLNAATSWLVVILVCGIVTICEILLRTCNQGRPNDQELLQAYEHGMGPTVDEVRAMRAAKAAAGQAKAQKVRGDGPKPVLASQASAESVVADWAPFGGERGARKAVLMLSSEADAFDRQLRKRMKGQRQSKTEGSSGVDIDSVPKTPEFRGIRASSISMDSDDDDDADADVCDDDEDNGSGDEGDGGSFTPSRETQSDTADFRSSHVLSDDDDGDAGSKQTKGSSSGVKRKSTSRRLKASGSRVAQLRRRQSRFGKLKIISSLDLKRLGQNLSEQQRQELGWTPGLLRYVLTFYPPRPPPYIVHILTVQTHACNRNTGKALDLTFRTRRPKLAPSANHTANLANREERVCLKLSLSTSLTTQQSIPEARDGGCLTLRSAKHGLCRPLTHGPA